MNAQTQQQDRGKGYKKTLNLPRTSFAMRANLVQNEPGSLKRWGQQELYAQLRGRAHPEGPFVFHDGPPYANGSIHIGHLLNKVLKDFVVRSRSMMGFDTPYVPGWDCHGLPIEHRVVQELGEKARGMAPMQIRKRCRDYAEKYVKVQKKQFQRLLTLADYDEPYLTMDPAYEAGVLDTFADLVGRGLVYRGLKPVHWSIENRTALAEAELEYHEREDPAVTVLFPVEGGLPGAAGDGGELHLAIWTTTPWTLPANLAVAVHEQLDYGVYELEWGGRAVRVVIATELAGRVLKPVLGERAVPAPVSTVKGGQLRELRYRHPFIDRTGPVVTADYVTLEDGTGLVHTAPGHGVEDYQTGRSQRLHKVMSNTTEQITTKDPIVKAHQGEPAGGLLPEPWIYCPVTDNGTFDGTVPSWLAGKSVWEANELITRRLRDSGHLLHQETISHNYPHDWRGKTPVIFRATEQWFISVDKGFVANDDERGSQGFEDEYSLRSRAVKAVEEGVDFYPGWGRNRLRGMLESRPDWCISRQRAWGLPIPAFYHPEHLGEPLMTPASIRAVAAVVRKRGSDAWFELDAGELLAGYDAVDDDRAPAWARGGIKPIKDRLHKGSDIFDVWLESGSSWHAVLRQRELGYPADLYLEGSDQHRGWFQTSLLMGVGATGQAPFKALLTHGFMVDKHGRKMSKSLGNTVEVEDLLQDLGADVCRWWVASLSFENDIKVDMDFFKEAGEAYRKVRNTIRFLLSNLSDFDPGSHAHRFTDADAASLDAWALGELDALVRGVGEAYEGYHFRRAHERLFDFCNHTMSAVYLAAVKDRLYCDAPDAPRRRRTQTAVHTIADALIRLLAPILPHTADEAWRALHGEEAASVHLERFPGAAGVAAHENWPALIELRDQCLRAVEAARQGWDVDNPLDLGLALDPQKLGAVGAFDAVDLADLMTVSRVELRAVEAETGIEVLDLRSEPRCERSWKRDGTVKQRSDGGYLSDRDAAAVGAAGER